MLLRLASDTCFATACVVSAHFDEIHSMTVPDLDLLGSVRTDWTLEEARGIYGTTYRERSPIYALTARTSPSRSC